MDTKGRDTATGSTQCASTTRREGMKTYYFQNTCECTKWCSCTRRALLGHDVFFSPEENGKKGKVSSGASKSLMTKSVHHIVGDTGNQKILPGCNSIFDA